MAWNRGDNLGTITVSAHQTGALAITAAFLCGCVLLPNRHPCGTDHRVPKYVRRNPTALAPAALATTAVAPMGRKAGGTACVLVTLYTVSVTL